MSKEKNRENLSIAMNFMDNKLPKDMDVLSIMTSDNECHVLLAGDCDLRKFAKENGAHARLERVENCIHMYANLFGCVVTKVITPYSPEFEQEASRL